MQGEKKFVALTLIFALATSAYLFYSFFRAMFTELLGSGELSEKYSNKFTPVDSDLALILAKTCFYGHFSGESKVLIFGRKRRS